MTRLPRFEHLLAFQNRLILFNDLALVHILEFELKLGPVRNAPRGALPAVALLYLLVR